MAVFTRTVVNDTGYIRAPSGTTAQRATVITPVAGMIRYNTTEGALEAYNGTDWGGLVQQQVASETVWYEAFSGNDNSFKSNYEPAYISWLEAFEATTNVTQLNVYFGDPNNPTYSITNSSYISGLRSAIQSGSDYGSGTTSDWFMGWNCGSPSTTSSFTRGGNNNPSFHFGNASSCSCESSAVIRPLIGNDNWGGAGGGCSQGAQSMGMGFIGS